MMIYAELNVFHGLARVNTSVHVCRDAESMVSPTGLNERVESTPLL